MASSKSTVPDPIAETLVQETAASSTAATDVTGSAGDNGAAEIIHVVQVDNTKNVGVSYLKIYNAGTVTVGTTVPDIILPCPGESKVEYVFADGIPMAEGASVAAGGISFSVVQEPGTSGITDPGSDVEVKLLINT